MDLSEWRHGGQKYAWVRDVKPLVEGEPVTPFVRAAMAGDVTSSLTHSSASGLNFINADYTLTLSRLPDGEYIGLAALTHYSHAGVATGDRGPVRPPRPDRHRRGDGAGESRLPAAEPRLARLQDDDRDLPVGPGLVGVEVGVGLDQLRPQPRPFLGARRRRHARRAGRGPISMCTSGLAIRLSVPLGVFVAAAHRRHDDHVVAVSHVQQRGDVQSYRTCGRGARAAASAPAS